MTYPVNCYDAAEIMFSWWPREGGPGVVRVGHWEDEYQTDDLRSWFGYGNRTWRESSDQERIDLMLHYFVEFTTTDFYGKHDPAQVLREFLKVSEFWDYCGTHYSLMRAANAALTGKSAELWPPKGYGVSEHYGMN